MFDHKESDWKRRQHAMADAQQRPPTRMEYFAAHNSNLPVLRREILSVIDAWRDIQRTRTWWFRALLRFQRLFKGPPAVAVAPPPATETGPLPPPNGNGAAPSLIIRP